MIKMSRKEQMAAIKWCSHSSPLAYLVFSLNGKWGTDHDNDENIIFNFLKLWKSAKGAIIIQGIKRLEDISVPVHADLITLLMTMPARLERAKRFMEMKDFCRDMSNLFIWTPQMQDTWKGYIITALDGMEEYDECDRFFKSCTSSEELASMYAGCLIKRLEIDKAGEVLAPYQGSTNPDVEKQISILTKSEQHESDNTYLPKGGAICSLQTSLMLFFLTPHLAEISRVHRYRTTMRG